MDPITLATLISTIVIGGLTLVINLWQSIKENHFKLDCGDCCTMQIDTINQDQK